jgi:GNAT superfamily N-acetyltransferase
MADENTVENRMLQFDKDKEYLKQFKSGVIDYEYTLSEIKYHGIQLSAGWRSLGIGKQLYVSLEALEKERNCKYWSDATAAFSFPADEIPSVIEKLKKFYLIATKPDSEV